MGRYEDIENARNDVNNATKWVEGLSDQEFASLDVKEQIEAAEWKVKYYTSTLKELKKQYAKMPEAPKKPGFIKEFGSMIGDVIHNAKWRFRGRRGEQEKVYHLPKGSLTDGGW